MFKLTIFDSNNYNNSTNSFNINSSNSKDKLLLSLLKYFCYENALDYDNVLQNIKSQMEIEDDGNSDKYLNELMNFLNKSNKNKLSKNFINIDKIGQGSFGTVYKTFNVLDNKYYALKITNINNNEDFKECRMLSKLSHPNIIRYYSVWSELNKLYLQTELCNEDLKNYIINRNILSKQDIYYFSDILKGLSYLHSNNIVHRDLKSSNILIINNTAKICDFNLSKIKPNNNLLQIDSKSSNKNIKKMNENTKGIGTELYSSPEQLNGWSYDYRVDIYSLGIIYFELISIFKDNFDRIDKIINLKENKNFITQIKSLDKTLILKMTDNNYLKRPTAFDIINLFNKRYKTINIPIEYSKIDITN